MTSAFLEKLVLTGSAQVLTHNHVNTAASKISIPANNIAVVTKLVISPFTALISGEDPLTPKVAYRSQSVTELSSSNTPRKGFLVRNTPYVYVNPIDGQIMVQNSEPVTFDTLLSFNKDIYVQTGIFPGVGEPGAAYDIAALSPQSNIPQQPQGYGGLPVLRNIVYGDGTTFQPAGFPDNTPAGFSGAMRVEPFPYYAGSGYVNANLDNNNFTPLVFVEYILINDIVLQSFQQ